MSEMPNFSAPIAERAPKKAIEINPESVKILGIEIPRNPEPGVRVPPAERFTAFTEDEFSLELLRTIAKTVKLDQPLLLEGEAAVGKSYTIEYLAHLAGREVYRMSLNGQTDTTDLIGKWVPRTEGLRKRVTTLLDNPNKCQSHEARALIESKKVAATAEAQTEAKAKGAGKNVYEGFERAEMEEICRLEGIEVPEGDWAWQDGDIPKQMKNGAWSVLDEVNTCEPQILVRLNALLERGGQLVLSEDGSKVVDRHPDFRLFATVNPPGGRYKGRIPLSAEWISRWNYQNAGELPKEIRAARLAAQFGVPQKPVELGKLKPSAPESLASAELVELYGSEWVADLCAKYSEFAEKAKEMLLAGEIGKDQKQVFDFDQRDDGRFKEYILAFHESGQMNKVIREAIEFIMINKIKSAADRKKLRDVAFLLIKIEEPKPRMFKIIKQAEESEVDPDLEAEELQRLINEVLDEDLPPGHADLLLGKDSDAKAELSPELLAIMEHEQQKLHDFFGRDIEVPPLPEGITAEQVQAWEAQHLKLHYLPLIDMSKEDIEGWIKPDFKYLTESDLPKDAMLLPGSWLLVDERPKPKYESGNQQYDNDTDFLGPVLEELRQKGLIQSFKHPGSRFYISPQELENPAVIEAIARAYNLKPEQITLPRMIEFNVLGNIHHPEWGESNCSEWFSDQYKAGLERLYGGRSDYGGLAYVYSLDPDDRNDFIGFRALGRFS